MVLLIYTGLTKEVINSIDTKYFGWFNYLELLNRIMLTKLSFDIKLHKLMLLWVKVINYDLRWSPMT